ncbi:MAG: hypothetical protein DMF68_03080 [Acidobacteria bacterium]|nr:MAG: hypothetical protein DMF68_03080 [Acidobacteriota bacterium]
MKRKNILLFSTLILTGAAIAYTVVRMQQGRVKTDDDWNEEDQIKSRDISDKNSYLSDNNR